MRARFLLLLLSVSVAGFGLSACGGATQEESDAALKRTINEPLDKAKAVDAATQQRVEDIQKRLDDAESQSEE
jgi:hypothetical protein